LFWGNVWITWLWRHPASSRISARDRGTRGRPFSFGTRGMAPVFSVAPSEVFA
jgi:hypothetical protein